MANFTRIKHAIQTIFQESSDTMAEGKDPPRWSSAPTLTARSEQKDTEPKQPFPLMKLPPELRLMIYREYLAPVSRSTANFKHTYTNDTSYQHHVIFQKGRRHIKYRHAGTTKSYPMVDLVDFFRNNKKRKIKSLKDTCKVLKLFRASDTIRDEAAPLFFSHTHFIFLQANCAARFLSGLPPTYTNLITSVAMGLSGNGAAAAARHLSKCENLRSLRLNVYPEWIYYQRGIMSIDGIKNLQLIRGVRKLIVCTYPWAWIADWDRFVRTLQVVLLPRAVVETSVARVVKARRRKSKSW